ncbi:intracellular septation protein A [Pseudonocardia hierapolitana]|uniref:Intracellular septation protein A n=1 Tax=Pseudonocardia hierapolitana TaxID=1128676 RepID=A0A561SMA9_9PSEU|nr:VC0807 family protein [Pseudonocardia hierapolitana]TWF76005.1 intracellular septation protein A [Pseudonocardia hierapolitana]
MTQTTPRTPATAAPRRAMFLGLFRDIGLSLAAYYGLRAVGASPSVALLGGTVTAGLRIAYVWLRTRRFDGFAAFMLAEFGVGLGFALLTGDARFLVAKESFSTAVAGLIFLASCGFGRPMIWHAAARFQPEARAELDRLWCGSPGFRRTFRMLTIGWGAGMLAEAVARVVVAYTLPVDAAAGLSQLLRFGAMGLLVLWTLATVKRRRASRS